MLDPSEFPPVFEPDSLEEDPDWVPDIPASRTRFFEKKRSSADSGSPISKNRIITTPEMTNISRPSTTESGSSSTSGTAQQESRTDSRDSPDVNCAGQLQNNSPEIVEQESDLEILEERKYTMNGPRKLKRVIPVPDDECQVLEKPTHPRGLRKPEKAIQSQAVKRTMSSKRSARDVYYQSDMEDEHQNEKRRKIMERNKAMLLNSPSKRASQNSKLPLSNLYRERKKASLSSSPPKDMSEKSKLSLSNPTLMSFSGRH
jgi:hypothetical protein